MARKQRIRILKDVNLSDSQEDPPAASKKRIRISKQRLLRASNRRRIWKLRARASKRKGNSKARKDLQKDPPTSSSAETTIEPCSHPSSHHRICDVCGLFLQVCGVPFDITQRWLGRISTEDVLWVWP